MKKKKNEVVEEQEFFIDYEMFTVDELVKIMNFYKLMEAISKGRKYKRDEVILKYNEYRSIINNISLEKQYDKELQKEKKFSIHALMKDIIGE